MACGPVDGADHGGRGWPARAGAGWGASIGEAAVNPERPRAASASVTPNIFGAATRPASRVTVMHNMLGNWDVDNDPAVGDAGERASRKLFSSADQRDGSTRCENMASRVRSPGTDLDRGWCAPRSFI